MPGKLASIIRSKKSCKVYKIKKFEIKKPAVVSKAESIEKAISLAGGLDFVSGGDSVLIKANINSDDEYPGTSNTENLKKLIKMVQAMGAKAVVGDMSSIAWPPTEKCAVKTGIAKAVREADAGIIYFENYGWCAVELPATSMKKLRVTEVLSDFDHLINLTILKTHRIADFTLSLKNMMGCIHFKDRLRMHVSKLKQRIAEINLAFTPSLNILDGTQSFIDGGPDKGVLRDSKVVLCGSDRVALDVVGVRTLQQLGSQSLAGMNPWEHPQIKTAVELGLGISCDNEIRIVQG